MRIARARRISDDAVIYVSLTENQYTRINDPFKTEKLEPTDEKGELSDLRLLVPCEPSKIVCAGLNYYDHAEEMHLDIPNEPLLFLKPPSALISHDDTIVYPSACKQLDYEAEIAIVVGRQAKDVSEEDATDYIFGYTCLNDVTARDLQKTDKQWTRAKSFDTFCPVGPWIETELDWKNVAVISRLNGKICQNGISSKMIFDVKRIFSYASKVMTLFPGDVIATGTPGGIGPMKPGDCIEIEIGGIGVLRNSVTD